MQIVSTLPDILSLTMWLLAATLYVWHWFHPRRIVSLVGDVAVLAGMATAAWSVVWKTGPGWPDLAAGRSIFFTALSVFSLLVYVVLTGYRSNRLPAVPILVFAVAVQIYVQITPGTVGSAGVAFLPVLAGVGVLVSLVGYGALVTIATAVFLNSLLWRVLDRFPVFF